MTDAAEQATAVATVASTAMPPLGFPRPSVRSARTAYKRHVQAFQKLLLQNPSSGLLDFLMEADEMGRDALTLAWIERRALEGDLPLTLAEDDQQKLDCCEWLRENLLGLLRKLFEELDALRTYKATDNANLSRAIQHINHTMCYAKFSHH